MCFDQIGAFFGSDEKGFGFSSSFVDDDAFDNEETRHLGRPQIPSLHEVLYRRSTNTRALYSACMVYRQLNFLPDSLGSFSNQLHN
jgi:hypothetical protein